MTARLDQVFREHSVPYAPGHDAWATHARPGRFAPVGIMLHHTAGSRRGDHPTLGLCIRGRGGPRPLPGPLCNCLTSRGGMNLLVSNGRAADSGPGHPQVLERVSNDLAPVGDAAAVYGLYDTDLEVDGNSHFYDFEIENAGDGQDPYPAEQVEAVIAACVALCRVHHWTANRVIAHREWTRRKVDPRGLDMTYIRSQVARRLSGLPSSTTQEDPLMARAVTSGPRITSGPLRGRTPFYRLADDGKGSYLVLSMNGGPRPVRVDAEPYGIPAMRVPKKGCDGLMRQGTAILVAYADGTTIDVGTAA